MHSIPGPATEANTTAWHGSLALAQKLMIHFQSRSDKND